MPGTGRPHEDTPPPKDVLVHFQISKEMFDQIAKIDRCKSRLIRYMVKFTLHDFEHRNDPAWLSKMIREYTERLEQVTKGNAQRHSVAVPAVIAVDNRQHTR